MTIDDDPWRHARSEGPWTSHIAARMARIADQAIRVLRVYPSSPLIGLINQKAYELAGLSSKINGHECRCADLRKCAVCVSFGKQQRLQGRRPATAEECYQFQADHELPLHPFSPLIEPTGETALTLAGRPAQLCRITDTGRAFLALCDNPNGGAPMPNPTSDASSPAPDTVTAPALYRQLAFLERVASPKAISVNYRALALSPEHASAAAPFAAMRCLVDLGLTRAVCVDAADFLVQLKRAPAAPFAVKVTDNALHYRCGAAHGRLSLVEAEVPLPVYNGDLTPLAPEFGIGLELGALASGNSTVFRNAGIEGVQLHNRATQAYAVASDDRSLSCCCLGPALPMAEDTIVTLKPVGAELLADVVKRYAGDEMYIGVDDASVYFLTMGMELQVNQIAPLRDNLNLLKEADKFTGHKTAVPLLHETVTGFLRRAEPLAETRRSAMVEISVVEGRVTLLFKETNAETGEHYDIVPDGPKVTVPPVRIEAQRLAKVLKYADRMVFDYAARNILVLHGDGGFIFAISGGPRGGQ